VTGGHWPRSAKACTCPPQTVEVADNLYRADTYAVEVTVYNR
jgi:hypothetical protein